MTLAVMNINRANPSANQKEVEHDGPENLVAENEQQGLTEHRDGRLG